MRFGIIGGTGFDISLGRDLSRGRESPRPEDKAPATATHQVETPFGPAAVEVSLIAGEQVAFIARHGPQHTIPPHLVNYRANIAALKSLGVTRVLASAAVGSLNPAIQPGEFALPTQFLDFTRGRADTLFAEVRHVDMTVPYCPQLRAELEQAGRFLGQGLHPSAVYVCTQGPRFETPAEIEMFRRLGGDLVGMTGVPEAPLAREAGLCYAALAVITNWAAGMSQEPLDEDEISARMREHMATVQRIFARVIEAWRDRPCDDCAPAHEQP
jgi:5'-methylthioadenosine phosphorylase